MNQNITKVEAQNYFKKCRKKTKQKVQDCVTDETVMLMNYSSNETLQMM